MQKTLATALGLAAVAGSAALIASAWNGIETARFLARAVEVEGRVSGPDPRPDRPYFSYEYPPGTPRGGRSRIESDGYRYLPGDAIPLYVDPDRPDRAEVRDFMEQWLATLVPALLGLALAGPGFAALAYVRVKAERKAYLLARGVRVRAAIEHVSLNPLINVNGVSPCVVVASALIDGKVHTFTSDSVWYDPTPYLDRDRVDVYYRNGDPSRYHMDLSFLPPPGN